MLLGSAAPLTSDARQLAARLARGDHDRVRASLQEIGLGGPEQLLSTYAGRATELRSWLAGAAINRDRDLRLQYLAGMGLNLQIGPAIYDSMLIHRRFPDGLIAGPEPVLAPLRRTLQPKTAEAFLAEWWASLMLEVP